MYYIHSFSCIFSIHNCIPILVYAYLCVLVNTYSSKISCLYFFLDLIFYIFGLSDFHKMVNRVLKTTFGKLTAKK